MTIQRTASALLALAPLVVALSPPPPAAAQEPAPRRYATETPDPSALVAPCCRFTNYYLWPSEPQHWECCAPLVEPVLSAELAGGGTAPEPEVAVPRGSLTLNRANPRVGRRGVENSCVNLATLTPLERLVRQLRSRTRVSCVEFVVYDHFPCSCETLCNDPTWVCDCPGVPIGELPEIKPQDSLGSQPEFLGTQCFPCNELSSCSGATPPGGGGSPS